MLMFGEYSAELVKDPFGILTGERYEFMIGLELPEEDELYSDNGVSVRALVRVDGGESKLISYDLLETTTLKMLDYDLEDDEEAQLADFCREHLPE